MNVSADEQGGAILPSFQESDLFPGPYSISFSTSPSLSGQAVSSLAYVNWKVEGQQRQRVISVANGAIISGVCDGVGVQVRDVTQSVGEGSSTWNPGFTYSKGQIVSYNGIMWYSLTNGNIGKVPTNEPDYWNADAYSIYAQIAPGIRPTTGQPPVLVTTPPFVITKSRSPITVDILPDMGIISAMVMASSPPGLTSLVSTDVTVSQIGISGSVAASYYPMSGPPAWVTIYPGSTGLEIYNNNASSLEAAVTVIFGIEG